MNLQQIEIDGFDFGQAGEIIFREYYKPKVGFRMSAENEKPDALAKMSDFSLD